MLAADGATCLTGPSGASSLLELMITIYCGQIMLWHVSLLV